MSHFECAFDKLRLDRVAIHGFLTASYWSPGIPRDTVKRAIENSLCIGLCAPAAEHWNPPWKPLR
jgi:hypothetical protein